MRFEVPQFIDVDNKIFGPLTWKQFLYMGGGIGASVVLYLKLPFLLALLLIIPIMSLAGALSFYSVNNRPFVFFLEAIFNYLSQNKLYLWRQSKKNVYTGQQNRPSGQAAGVPAPPATKKTNSNITSLACRLELEALQKEE